MIPTSRMHPGGDVQRRTANTIVVKGGQNTSADPIDQPGEQLVSSTDNIVRLGMQWLVTQIVWLLACCPCVDTELFQPYAEQCASLLH